jgi:Skp family chaperone for outer membrane proteins
MTRDPPATRQVERLRSDLALADDLNAIQNDQLNKAIQKIAKLRTEVEQLQADNAELQKQKDYWQKLAISRALEHSGGELGKMLEDIRKP